MKSITLPVSRLTRAMLLRKYGSEPIRLDRADIRRKELMHVGTSNKHMERKQHALNTSITLQLNNHEADHLAGKLAEVGYYLYQQDKIRIFLFVWARVTAGLPALQAIYDYYSLHNIEEDDFAIETAERLWKRWRKEKEKEVIYFTPQVVPFNISLLLSIRQADSVASRLSLFMEEECIDMDPRLKKAVRTWVYYDLTSMTQIEVSKKMDMPQGNVSRSLSSIRSYLPYNDELRKYIAYCLATTKAQPTPSAAS
jgi:hypothetical protein